MECKDSFYQQIQSHESILLPIWVRLKNNNFCIPLCVFGKETYTAGATCSSTKSGRKILVPVLAHVIGSHFSQWKVALPNKKPNTVEIHY